MTQESGEVELIESSDPHEFAKRRGMLMNNSIASAVVAALLLFSPALSAQSRMTNRGVPHNVSESVIVYVFPHELSSRDRLQDGQSGRSLALHDNTLLLWVDMFPAARFSHRTAYVLISPEGTQIEEGAWWPVLNGRGILHSKPNFVSVISPFQVKSTDSRIEVHFHSEELSADDKLADGSGDTEIPLWSKSFLVWIDMKPGLFFKHPTLYLLIGADKTIRVLNGNWWPELNGRMILYGTTDKYGVLSPFKIPW